MSAESGYPTVRLWTRLSRGVESGAGTYSDREVLASVREHLEWLLNTRQGDSPACPTFGLPDLTGVIAGLPKTERRFSEAIENSILEHEPRITWVRVTIDEVISLRRLISHHFVIEFALKDVPDEYRRQIIGQVDIDSNFSLRQ